MVASRKEERLKQAAEEMKKNISSDSLAEIDHVQCNIRKEEQVIITSETEILSDLCYNILTI